MRITVPFPIGSGDSATLSRESAYSRILEALPGSERELVWGIGEEVTLVRGQLITKANQPFSHVYFPESAVFSLVTDFRNGSSVESGTVGNEGFVGLPIFLGGESCPQRIISQIGGTACRVPSAAFQSSLSELPILSSILKRYLLAYIAQVSQTSACNSQHTVSERCARWILLTHDRVGSSTIPLTQEFLAYMLGVRRPSVTVAQAALQKKRLIRYSRGKLDVTDRAGLEKESCECYGAVRAEFEALLGVPVG